MKSQISRIENYLILYWVKLNSLSLNQAHWHSLSKTQLLLLSRSFFQFPLDSPPVLLLVSTTLTPLHFQTVPPYYSSLTASTPSTMSSDHWSESPETIRPLPSSRPSNIYCQKSPGFSPESPYSRLLPLQTLAHLTVDPVFLVRLSWLWFFGLKRSSHGLFQQNL